jgi:hypothetical protein
MKSPVLMENMNPKRTKNLQTQTPYTPAPYSVFLLQSAWNIELENEHDARFYGGGHPFDVMDAHMIPSEGG